MEVTPEYLFQIYQTTTELVMENRTLRTQLTEMQKKYIEAEKKIAELQKEIASKRVKEKDGEEG